MTRIAAASTVEQLRGIWKKSRNCGISRTGAGSSIVAMTTANSRSRPRNRSRAKA